MPDLHEKRVFYFFINPSMEVMQVFNKYSYFQKQIFQNRFPKRSVDWD